MKSRKPATLSAKLERNLSTYAVAARVAGVGLLALARPVQAEIIYTPQNCRVEPGSPYECPFNLDGQNLADFAVYFASYRDGIYLSVVGRHYSAQMQFQSSNFANARKTRGKIGPRRQFDRGNSTHQMAVQTHSGAVFGPWANVKSRYLGLRIDSFDGNYNYGWARLNVQFGQGHTTHATLTGYAYETEPNKPIVAGDEGRGASLGHLALGAARKRRPPLTAGTDGSALILPRRRHITSPSVLP